jgi:hypothetical protein
MDAGAADGNAGDAVVAVGIGAGLDIDLDAAAAPPNLWVLSDSSLLTRYSRPLHRPTN